MMVDTALGLIKNLIYKPEWEFEAEDYTKRFESAIRIKVTYPAYRSEREDAPDGYPNAIRPYASFVCIVGDCNDAVTLYRRIIRIIMEIEEHEAREFLRVKPTYWSPFNPHHIDGMNRWGTPDRDVVFGLA